MVIRIDEFSQHDQQLWDEELSDFVPDRIFDAHIHLFDPQHVAPTSSHVWSRADLGTLQHWAARLYPGRQVHFLCLGTPVVGVDVGAHSQWCIQQVQQDAQSRLQRLVTPSCRLQDIERDLQQPGVTGLKPYRLFSASGDVAQCRIHEFLPHEQLELASHYGAWVTLHLSRYHGCADHWNLDDLQEFTQQRYPGIKWILAHCARSFTYWPIRQAIDRLRDMPNLWYDVSAVTDVRPLITLMTRENPRRILYGSDGVDATCFRGQYVALGRAWQGLDLSQVSMQFPHCDARPVLAIYEQLLSMKHAAEIAQWSTDDIENMFWRNAAELFDIQFASTATDVDSTPKDVTQRVYQHARERIPGGTQLLSKRPEMFAPGRWPAYASQARGCEVIDLDGRRFIDMTTSGIGSCLLGYADPEVTQAVQQRISRGSMSSLNAVEEVDLADLLVQLHPWSEQVRYTRSGGEAMAVAVRLVRAATGRERIAFCGYHGWSDWYLAANLSPQTADPGQSLSAPHGDQLCAHLLPGLLPSGVPSGLAGTALPFTYNRLEQLQELVRLHGSQLAAVVMEPTRSLEPDPGFLQGVRELCDECGAALVFDEISSGWRMHAGGVHLKYGVAPDVAVFAKAISNGHPMAAVLGRKQFMNAAQMSFISSTYWTEAVGPAAALATIRKMQKVDLVSHVDRIGQLMRTGWEKAGQKTGVPVVVRGHNALLHLAFDHADAAALGTLLTVRMLDRGFLTGGGFYPSLAHTVQHVEHYLTELEIVFHELAEAMHRNDVLARLTEAGCQVRHSGFQRLA